MSDDPDYDAYADWVPPAKVYMDDIPRVSTLRLGKVPFWKSCCGYFESAHRDDPHRQRRRRR